MTGEPAWYQSNKFGVRLGNVLEVVTKPEGYLGFLETTLVPFDPKLIDKSMLTDYEVLWLNAYNERIRKIVGPELNAQGMLDVYYWMTNKTIPFETQASKTMKSTNSAVSLAENLLGIVLVIMNALV
ncbi:xaa-Pro aminopeptidase 2-like [Hyposmocoma kahamanoa]|uniref:xaa-Pro aminopeptidase 2-like n=1 Tax=Hyposmocoma kahamanoa TaxID=1477025 RepID=UPI000E6DA170|nr:xaa-Pro aminopeptidase 2-like [Hyposmocoma kahamanoa]